MNQLIAVPPILYDRSRHRKASSGQQCQMQRISRANSIVQDHRCPLSAGCLIGLLALLSRSNGKLSRKTVDRASACVTSSSQSAAEQQVIPVTWKAQARLLEWLVKYQVSVPAGGQSPILVLTWLDVQ